MKKLSFFLAGLALALPLLADTTHTWEQRGYEDFDKGTLQHLSLRSDGRLLLAPQFRQLSDAGLSYIWAVAEDKRGNVYLGGGSPGKVIKIDLSKSAKETSLTPEVIFSAKELEVHALAVDSDNNLYAATSPDPKIYKISPDGKTSSVFYEPKAKYVWAMAFAPGGDLLVATGDKGEVFSVDRKGQGKVFVGTDEVHARSMVIDPKGNVILGTDPGGLIMRVSPAGQAFVLYQAAKKEVTALEIGPDGSIYAAAVGDKPPRVTPSAPAPVQPVPQPQPILPGVTPPAPPPVPGGTEVYRIFPDGEPRRIWTSKDDVVYTMAIPEGGKLLMGTGNKGKIIQVDSEELYTSLLRAQATQVTVLVKQRNGAVLAATSNTGKLFQVGRDYESEGSFESEVFDARIFSYWGRLFWRGENFAGTGIALHTRSGNVDNSDHNWSPWSSPYKTPGDKNASPGARFLQWKAVLTSTSPKSTPWLESVELAYLPKNVPPVIDDVQAAPFGYKFQQAFVAPVQPAAATITLPALGQPKPPQVPIQQFESPATAQQAKGWQGVRWAAHDDNGDTLTYSLYIRGKDEHTWKLLKDKINEKLYSWDATAFPDGVYVAKVVASDAASNPEGDALTDERESGPFTIDNTPPQVAGLRTAVEGKKWRVTFHAVDALNTIKRAEYSLDGSDWKLVPPVGELSDAMQEDYNFTVDSTPGEHVIAVRVSDRVDNIVVEKTVIR